MHANITIRTSSLPWFTYRWILVVLWNRGMCGVKCVPCPGKKMNALYNTINSILLCKGLALRNESGFAKLFLIIAHDLPPLHPPGGELSEPAPP